jgi:Hydrolases of the alpha/beta superfamily
MYWRWVGGLIIIGVLIAALAWIATSSARLARENREQTAQIRQLQEKLEYAQQDFISQREMLRGQSLTGTVRSPDEFLALFPAKYPQGNWQPAESIFEDCWFRSADGLRLHGWLLHRDRPSHVMLLVHGNAGNLTHRAQFAQQLSERYSASVLTFDYRGYGRSEGTPTIPGLLADARAARTLLAERAQMSPQEIILIGESLGGAIAVDLAANDGARAMILQSTFSSLKEVAAIHYPAILVDTLVANRLDSATKIKQYRGPVFQVHGDADRTIPIALGRKLFEAANEPKVFVSIPGHDHNDPLPDFAFQSLDEFINRLPSLEK